MDGLDEYSYFRWILSWESLGSGLLLAGVFLGIMGTLLALLWSQTRRRGRQVKAAAALLGYEFRKGHDPDAQRLYPQFRKTQTRLPRDGFHTARGHLRLGDHFCEVRLGDCAFRFGKSDAITRAAPEKDALASYVMVRLPWPQTPRLAVRRDPRNPKLPLLAVIESERVDFESEEFNRRFDVFSSRRRFAYDLIDPRMMEFLLRSDPPTLSLEEGWLLATPPGGGVWMPRDFAAAVDWLQAFLSRWPAHVVAEFQGEAAGVAPGPRRY